MSKINTTWEYNDLQFDVDMQDVDFSKHYHDVFEKMEEDAQSIPKAGETFEIIGAYFNMYQNMFDRLFGEGTTLKLTDGKKSNTLAEEAYDSLLQFISDQNNAAQQRRMSMTQRYSPNRAQRRAAERK